MHQNNHRGSIVSKRMATLAVAVAGAAALMASQTARAQSVWNGTVGGSWAVAGNWTGGLPTTSSNVSFAATGTTTVPGTVTSILPSNLQIASLNFNNIAPSGSPTYHRVDVGANTLTVSSASTATTHFVGPTSAVGTDTTNVAFTGTATGSFVLSTAGDVTFQRTASVTATTLNSTVDFSGLPALRLSAANLFFGRTTGTAANGLATARSRVILADSTTLTATGSVTVGSAVAYTAASGGSATGSLTGATGVLLVGRDTTVRAASLVVGAAKSNGSILVAPGISNGTFTLSGVTPGTRATLWGIGEWNTATDQSTTQAFGTVNLTGVTVNALVTNLNVGHGANNSAVAVSGATGVLTFTQGTIDATTVLVGVKRQFNASTAATGSITLGTQGGSASSPVARLLVGGNMSLGTTETAGTIATSAIGTLTLHAGGTVAVSGNVVDGGANNGASLAQSDINLNPFALLQVGGSLGSAAAPIDNLIVNGGTLSLALKPVGTASASVTTLATGADTTNIVINSGSVAVGSTYTLVKYGTLNNFNFFLPANAIAGLGARSTATLLNNQANSSIDLQITGDSPQWSGALDGVWSLAVQADPKNWQLVTAATATDYIETDAVLFNDTAVSKAVNLVSTVNPSSVTVNNSAGDYAITGTGSIAGSSSLIKQGSSKLTVSTANTFSGPVTVTGGTLEVTTSNALGTGTAASVSSGAQLTLAGNTAVSGRTLTVSGEGVAGDGALFATGGTATWGGGVTLVGATRIGTDSVSSLAITGDIAGTSNLTLSGGGRILLSGNNAFGTTIPNTAGTPASLNIEGGTTVVLGSAGALPAATSSTGSLWLKAGRIELNGLNVTAGGTVASTNQWNLGGGPAGVNSTIDTGTGTLTLGGGLYAQSANGVANTGANGAPSDTAYILGQLELGGGNAAGALPSARVITVFDAAAPVDLEITARISGNGVGLNKAGGGVLRLSADNTFNGGVHIGTGILEIASDSALGAVPASPATRISYSAGSIRLLSSFDINPNRSIVFANTLLSGQIDTGGFTSTYAGSISNLPGTVGGLSKAGAGVLTLTGNLAYVGPTTVTGGTLVVRQPLLTSSSLVTSTGSATGTVALLDASHSAAQGTYAYAGSFASVLVNPGSTVRVGAADRATFTPNVLRTDSLTITTDTQGLYDGFVDLTNNDLIAKGGNVAALRAMVKQWLNAGARDGLGLGSSVASSTAFTTLAVFPNTAGEGAAYFASYDGVSGLTADDVIVKYTYEGDTNIDGRVNGQDLVNALEGYSLGLTGWANGDFDYDGAVTDADLSRLLAAIAANPVSLGDGSGTPGNSGAVPEPAALGLLLPALATLTRRRRR